MGEYTIELWSLDPYPQTPDDSLALEDYHASLVVRSLSSPHAPADAERLGAMAS